MAREDILVEGDKELVNTFKQLPQKVDNKIIGPALRHSARPIVTDAKARLRKGKGRRRKGAGSYHNAMGTELKRQRRKGVRLLRVGARWSKTTDLPTNIGSLLEFGHGGPAPAPPIPHLRPAMDAQKDEVARRFHEKAWQGIEKQTEQLAKKG